MREQLQTHRDVFLFRYRYTLAPTDPRVLDATLEQMQLDHECHAAIREGAEEQQCDGCGAWTYRGRCPHCPGRPSTSRGERLADRERAGEQVPWEEWTREFFPDGRVAQEP